jgi:hypothetical protein
MRRNQRRLVCLGISILGVLTLSPASLGQASPDSETAFPVTTDWSHHHVIYSRPATAEQAKRLQQDVRYSQQLNRQSSAKLPKVATEGTLAPNWQLRSNAANNQKLNGDWAQDLGTGASVGAGNFPAKFSFSISTANCGTAPQPDFVVFSTGLLGSATQASIVAYDNLYSGCSGTVPSVYWAFDTGGTILTSPVFSRDGTQLAYVQKSGSLVLLKWAASTTETVSNPMSLTPVMPALYPACPAPCMTLRTLRNSGGTADNDTNSSVFYDYPSDTDYVGDDAGWLHKFTPVFKGVLTEIRTGGWPVQVNPVTPTVLTSPVHDFSSGSVFVADAGGFLYRVDSTGAVTTSGQLDFSVSEDGSPGIVQGPIVDSSAGQVYVFATSDGSGGCIGGADCSAVYELTTTFVAGDTGSETVVGASTVSPTSPSPLYLGAFDSTYENSVNATGNMYVCGNTGGPPILYQVAIVAGGVSNVSIGPVLSTSTTPCSPVSDVFNPNATGGATEWVFASAQDGGVSSGCSSGGCIFNFKDTPWKASTAYSVGQEILDNHFQIQVVSVAGTSGASAPGWSTIVGHSTTDHTVHWLDQGVQSAFPPATWIRLRAYTKGKIILDTNSNIQLVTTAGTSGGTIPTFNTTAGGITNDGTVKWTNLGALGTAALAVAGGASGIVIDNTVGSGTEPGASQVYFSTLSDQVCGTSGTGGCATQASQSALK